MPGPRDRRLSHSSLQPTSADLRAFQHQQQQQRRRSSGWSRLSATTSSSSASVHSAQHHGTPAGEDVESLAVPTAPGQREGENLQGRSFHWSHLDSPLLARADRFSVGPETRAKTAHLADLALSASDESRSPSAGNSELSISPFPSPTPEPLSFPKGESPPVGVGSAAAADHPSALSVLLSRSTAAQQHPPPNDPDAHSPASSTPATSGNTTPRPWHTPASTMAPSPPSATPSPSSHSFSPARRGSASASSFSFTPSERTPLLPTIHASPPASSSSTASSGDPLDPREPPSKHARIAHFFRPMRKWTWGDVMQNAVREPVRLIPAVVLGLLLNILDGGTDGLWTARMIMFPASPIFEGFGGDGVSMFFVSCIISQLVYTCGGSIFHGGNGSMMIEVVPFFHILTEIITAKVGEKNAHSIIATTMVAFALSSILIGLTFFVLGRARLGVLIGFFPRHILVGCIGGVGVFLLETGLEVTAGLKEEGFSYTKETFNLFFRNLHIFMLWFPALCLAILLRVLTRLSSHPVVTPAFFLAIPAIFYIVVAAAHLDVSKLREQGWVFDVGPARGAHWYRFYTYFDFTAVSWKALAATIPTQLALTFFGILHVPLNVPALGISLNEDNVNLDKELVGHGISNVLAGLLGTVPNYLCYVNSVLYYRVGGGSRLSGLMLAAATAGVLFAGPGPIGYLPVMVVGSLIFVLGIDLVKEAVWETWGRVNRFEYLTIWAIIFGMTAFDFVYGVLVGIVLACLFFVIQNARRRPIRALLSGESVKSTVRRHAVQRHFIHRIGSQTKVIRLQGFLFFGTISVVEETVRDLLAAAAWDKNPLRFVILDLGLVSGVDFSAAEAFVRIARLLAARDIMLVLCGIESPDSAVGVALRSVGCWSDRDEVRLEVAKDLNDALEYVENAYLRGLYSHPQSQKRYQTLVASGGIDFPKQGSKGMAFRLSESFVNSPRRIHLQDAAKATEPEPLSDRSSDSGFSRPTPPRNFAQPLPLLMGTFKTYSNASHEFYAQLAPYFTNIMIEPGEILWRQGDIPDGLYLIEKGILRASYRFDGHKEPVHETMLTGTVAGEISGLSGSPRNCTVACEMHASLWHISSASLARLEREQPAVAMEFTKILLKVASDELGTLTAHLASIA